MATRVLTKWICDLCRLEETTDGNLPDDWVDINVDLENAGMIGAQKHVCHGCQELIEKAAHP